MFVYRICSCTMWLWSRRAVSEIIGIEKTFPHNEHLIFIHIFNTSEKRSIKEPATNKTLVYVVLPFWSFEPSLISAEHYTLYTTLTDTSWVDCPVDLCSTRPCLHGLAPADTADQSRHNRSGAPCGDEPSEWYPVRPALPWGCRTDIFTGSVRVRVHA